MRLATLDDAKRLFSWRNDKYTREMSKNTAPITWSEHLGWLEARLAQQEPRLFVAELNGYPAGTVRIDDDNSLSYTIAPECRGLGYATAMLAWVYHQYGSCRAEIKAANLASIRAAQKAGHYVVLV